MVKNLLEQRLNQIKKVFDVNHINSLKPEIKSIAKYYKINKIPYNLFHRGDNFIHMGISRDGIFKKGDLQEQAKIVEKYINKKTKRILELATGRGANSIYLAKKYPNIEFLGVDLPNGQIDYAFKNSKKIENFKPQIGDFHDLNTFSDNSIDIVFVIEALCHSSNKDKVLWEVKRVLRKNGIFVIIDGYTKKQNSMLNKLEKISNELTAKGMMVEKFEYYPDFKKIIDTNFKIIYEEDASNLILPSLQKLEKKAKRFFSLPIFLQRLILKTFPYEFTNNVISGYLMPILIKNNVASYMVLVAEK